jgi:hypothetical protein
MNEKTKRKIWQHCSCECHESYCEICDHDDRWIFEKGLELGRIKCLNELTSELEKEDIYRRLGKVKVWRASNDEVCDMVQEWCVKWLRKKSNA